MITTKYHLHPPGKSWAGFSCSPGPERLPGWILAQSRPVKTPQNAAGAISLASGALLQQGNIPAYPDTKTQHKPGKQPRTQYTQKQQPRPAPENAAQAARTPSSAQTAPAGCNYTTQPQQGQQRRPQDAQTTPGPVSRGELAQSGPAGCSTPAPWPDPPGQALQPPLTRFCTGFAAKKLSARKNF